MNRFTIALATTFCLALAACGNEPATPAQSETDAFAARIKGTDAVPSTNDDAPLAMQSPAVAEPLQETVPADNSSEPASDPEAGPCDETSMGPFIGKVADARTRTAIADAAGPGREIRFLRPGEPLASLGPDQSRLYILLDAQDVISEAQCG